MAKYLVLIYGDEAVWGAAPPEWHEENARHHGIFHAHAGAAVLGGAELRPSSTAKSLRAGPDGKPRSTDGPFVETKEAVGGYYLIEAPDDDAAVALASLIPESHGEGSGVEVRRLAD